MCFEIINKIVKFQKIILALRNQGLSRSYWPLCLKAKKRNTNDVVDMISTKASIMWSQNWQMVVTIGPQTD